MKVPKFRIPKFRIWDGECFRGNLHEYFLNLKTGTIVEIAYSDLYDEWYNATNPDTEFTIPQSSGLFDKNGKEIYEGDIIKSNNWHKSTSSVLYGQGMFVNSLDYAPLSTDSGTCEVIGNILENPDLEYKQTENLQYD